MKKFVLTTAATAVGVSCFGWIALLLLLALFVNPAPLNAALGSYPNINTQTVADFVAQNSQVQQQLWIEEVLDTNGASYQSTPFADSMTGKIRAGQAVDDSELRKAVVEITDTSKVRGDTINIFSYAGIGGEGAYGSQTRNGTEAKIITGNMTVTIGNQLFSVGYKQSEVDKTMIGQDILKNPRINDGLRALHNKRKNDTIIWRMMQAAGFGGSTFAGTPGANLIYPAGIAGRSTLKSANTIDTPLIMGAGEVLPGNGAMPMEVTKDSGGSLAELFIFMSSDKGLFDFESDPTNNTYLQFAWDRGQDNPLFRGGLKNVRGHGLYRWIHRDHANYDNIGSPLLPRAKLGVALTGANTGDIIHGGGLLYTADTVPQWFKHFSNAPVVMYGGVNNIGATTATTRYVMIINPTGSYAVYSYTVNTGNAITIVARVSIGVGTESNTHPQGAVIVECNVLGTVIGRSLMFGMQAVVGGAGSIAGNPAGPSVGVIRRQELDMGNDIAIGVEACAGYSAVKRAGDGAYPGFVVVEHAISPAAVPGAPTIT